MEESTTHEDSSQAGNEISSQSGRGKNKKLWTPNEDKALVKSLLELVDEGSYKSDTGFRAGYLNVLEAKMAARGFMTIKAIPHIESRMKILKKDYALYAELLTSNSISGFGYDCSTGCVTADEAVWNDFLKENKRFSRIRRKSFPYYEELHTIYGHDRATGNEAMSFADMTELGNKEDANELTGIHDSTDGVPSPPLQAASRTKKRKRTLPASGMSLIASAIDRIGDKMTETGGAFCAAVKCASEQETQKMEMQNKLMGDLKKIELLMTGQRMFLYRKIGKDFDMLNMFFGLEDGDKEAFAISLLNDAGTSLF